MNTPHSNSEEKKDQDNNPKENALEEDGESATENQHTLQVQCDEMKNNWLRAMADLENLRRRSAREKEEALKYGATNFARDMVSVVDNLERALSSCSTLENIPDVVKPLISGVEMIAKELATVFERHGLTKISSLGSKFDPHFHQAMLEIETMDQEPGTIVQVLQEGYQIHDRLIRAAMVGVAKAPNL